MPCSSVYYTLELQAMTSEFIGGLLPVVYFFRKNDSLLHFVKPVFDIRVFLKTCTNGSSELMTNLSMSLVNALYNLQLMKIAGENGVAAMQLAVPRLSATIMVLEITQSLKICIKKVCLSYWSGA